MVEILFVFALLAVVAALTALLWRRRSRTPEPEHHEQTYQHEAREHEARQGERPR
jgi:hypothetical protein